MTEDEEGGFCEHSQAMSARPSAKGRLAVRYNLGSEEGEVMDVQCWQYAAGDRRWACGLNCFENEGVPSDQMYSIRIIYILSSYRAVNTPSKL
jgi:hypothetical protein